MERLQNSTACRQQSTTVVDRHAVSCVERLDLLALASTDRRLRPESLAVLIQLTTFVNAETGAAWPTQRRLGQHLGMVQANVSRALKQLEACGYLVRDLERLKPERRAITVYRLTFPRGPEGISPVTSDAPPRHITGDMGQHISPDMSDISPVIYMEPGKGNPVNEPGPGVPGGSGPERARAPAPAPMVGFLPDDWAPSEKAIANAMGELRMTRAQVEHETRRFIARCRSKATRSASWLDEWWAYLDNVRPGSPLRERLLGERNGVVISNRGNPGRVEDLAAWGHRD